MIKSVIMAGGEGKRLRPMTCTMPKPLVPLMGRPVIDYCIDLLKRHNITDITTTLYYLGSRVEEHLKDGNEFGVSVTHSSTSVPLGTAGSVKFAVKDTDKTILVVSGDTLTDCDISDALTYHKKNNSKVTIILKRVSEPTEYGVAMVGSDGKITRFIEKPSSSEIFSDLANTGMYIIEPEILNYIPDGRVYDFSMDLFPMLLNKNIPIYGYEMQGYWCDIGNIKQYMQAGRDLFDHKVDFNIPTEYRNGVYIEKNAHISENAQISAPCYISSGCEIGENAKIEAYSVIGKSTKVLENACIKRSVIMENSVIDESVQLRGAIICKNTEIGKFSNVFENSVIGENTVIGDSCTVSGGASIWPDKQINRNTTINDNVVWGIGKRSNLSDNGNSGCLSCDVSPEVAVRIGASFSSILPRYGQVAVSGDGRRVTSMLKRAATAGIISQGTDVMSLPHMPFFLFSYTVRHLGLAGGIYIDTDSTNSRKAIFTVCDHTGTAVTTSLRRKLDHEYSWGEHRPVNYREIGVVEEVTGSVKAYEAALTRNTDTKLFSEKQITILLDTSSENYSIAAPILMRLGINVLSANTDGGMSMQSSITSQNADIGVYIPVSNNSEMPMFMLKSGKTIGGLSLIALLARDTVKNGRASRFTVPVTFPDEYSRMLMDCGATLITAPENIHIWHRAAIMNNTDINEFFDPIASIIRICEIFGKEELEQSIDALPKTYCQENIVECTDFGSVLRSLSESEENEDTEPIDGIKIHKDNGWVIVKSADGGLSACRIICGSFKEEYANELSDMYIDKLKSIIRHG